MKIDFKINFKKGTGTFILGWYMMIMCLFIAVVLIDQYSKYDQALQTQMAVDSIADGSATYASTLTGDDENEIEEDINARAEEIGDLIEDETGVYEINNYNYLIDVNGDEGEIDATIITHTPNSYGNFADLYNVDDGGLGYYSITRHTTASFSRIIAGNYAVMCDGDYLEGHVHFNQYDARWGNKLYGNQGTIASSACGPTSLAMVVTELTNTTLTPDAAADFSVQHGWRAYGDGSSHALITTGVTYYGLTCKVLFSESDMIQCLEEGGLIVATFGAGTYTKEGHFMTICDYENGLFTINDPNYRTGIPYKVSYDYLISAGNMEWKWGITKVESY